MKNKKPYPKDLLNNSMYMTFCKSPGHGKNSGFPGLVLKRRLNIKRHGGETFLGVMIMCISIVLADT